MEDYVDYLTMELEEIRPLKPHWLNTKPASFAVRPSVIRPPIARKRNKAGPPKVSGGSAKTSSSGFGSQSSNYASDMGGRSDADLRGRLQAYPDFIAKALLAADEAQAAGESELTVALVEVVCELLYEVGRRP